MDMVRTFGIDLGLSSAHTAVWPTGCSIPSSSQTGVRTNTTYPFALAAAPATSLDADPSRRRAQIPIQL
jgi:hypothetical protein